MKQMTPQQAREECAVMIMKTLNSAIKADDVEALVATFEAKGQWDEGHILAALRTIKPHALRLIDGL